MLKTKLKIEIEGKTASWSFDVVSSCEITEDVETLTDTCKLVLPEKIKWEGYENIPVTRGDKIKVWFGYEKPVLRFVGYVRTVGIKNPIEIDCEDGMFTLKQKSLKPTTLRACKLSTLLEYLLEGTGYDYRVLDDVTLGNYRVTKPTAATQLDDLKTEIGLRAYFRFIDGVSLLYVGFSYPVDNRQTQYFKYGHNLTVGDYDLNYQRREDMKLKIKATSMQRDNKKIEVTTGDTDGEEVQVYKYDVSKKALELFATEMLNKYKYTGLTGSFGTLAEPIVHKTDMVVLELKNRKPERYLVKKVVLSFGAGNYAKQVITLGMPLELTN